MTRSEPPSQKPPSRSQRKERAPPDNLDARMEEALSELGLAGARFRDAHHAHRKTPRVSSAQDGRAVAVRADGVDRAQFHFSPNPGEPPRPLSRVASGGELSRLMLALESVLRRADLIPTLIFDEVDAGIGGAVAEVVGRKAEREYRRAIRCSSSPTCPRSRAWEIATSGWKNTSPGSARRRASNFLRMQ